MDKINYIPISTKYYEGKWYYSQQQEIVETFFNLIGNFNDCWEVFCCEPSDILTEEQLETYNKQDANFNYKIAKFNAKNYLYRTNTHECNASLFSAICAKGKHDTEFINSKYNKNAVKHYAVIQLDGNGKKLLRGFARYDSKGLSITVNPEYTNYINKVKNKSVWDYSVEMFED